MPIDRLEKFFSRDMQEILQDADCLDAACEVLDKLESGHLRVASKREGQDWTPLTWVKTAILCSFRLSPMQEYAGWPGSALDKAHLGPQTFCLEQGVRIVPGGTAVRRGAYLASSVVVMPPAYVNVGAYVDEGSMIDSHALVGSCAQIGKQVHLSASAQIGGVLEPAGARPVIVEDNCFIGALCGLFEGVYVRRSAVLAPGVIITASTRIFDMLNERSYQGEVPEKAVVVPGTRAAGSSWAEKHGLSLYAPCIVKYRDDLTEASVALEEALR